jgi:DNA repair protein RecN (Recombination protein N)
MLTRLFVKDFVIVANQELHFDAGFAVFTGETGAGKSLLVDALSMLLGGRASADVVRTGAKQAEVAAEFDAGSAVLDWLQVYSLDSDEVAHNISASTKDTKHPISTSVLLRRTIDVQGKSRAYINGSPVTATQLREIGELLVDIFGQHAHQSLMRKTAVRALLDDYAKATQDAQQCASLHREWQASLRALAEAEQAQATLSRERDRLSFELEEINKLAPLADEWDELSGMHQRMSHSAELLQAAQACAAAIGDSDDSLQARLATVMHQLSHAASIDPFLADTLKTLQSVEVQLSDAAHTLSHYASKMEIDPKQLELMDARMSQWMSIARRHRSPPAELPALHLSKKSQLATLEAQQDLQALKLACDKAHAALKEAAAALSKKRKATAPKLAKAVTDAMQTLGMTGGRFEIGLEPLAEMASYGGEDIEFLIAGHAGAAPKPIAKVASGGELSRVALAIAVTTSAKAAVPTLIFDEVDAGVGGVTAQSVGHLMRNLALSAKDTQVLCVTHLAQVAAFAHTHYCVSKAMSESDKGKAVLSEARSLSGEERVSEIARMLGASAANADALKKASALASQLLKSAAHVSS